MEHFAWLACWKNFHIILEVKDKQAILGLLQLEAKNTATILILCCWLLTLGAVNFFCNQFLTHNFINVQDSLDVTYTSGGIQDIIMFTYECSKQLSTWRRVKPEMLLTFTWHFTKKNCFILFFYFLINLFWKKCHTSLWTELCFILHRVTRHIWLLTMWVSVPQW